MVAPVIQFKRGLLANLPGLQAGEPGFTTDSYDLYVGLTSETATNKIIGSHRFWTNNSATTGSGVNLVEGTNNGTQYITLKSPDSLSGIVTYTMPGTDGTNGQAIVTNGSGTLSFASVTTSAGTLTGAGAGVTTFLVTPSSANLASAVSDETGTGSLVFANTPTLVSPILGTPTSGTLTNCTGYPVANLANLGSGVATFLTTPSSANLISAVTDETGTGTLVFSASPTFTGTVSAAIVTASGGINGAQGADLARLRVTGITTLGQTNVTGFSNAGISTLGDATASTLNVSGFATHGATSETLLTVSGIATVSGVFNANGGVNATQGADAARLRVTGITTLGQTNTTGFSNAGVSTLGNATAATLNVSGIVTATSFSGNLAVGNITGLGANVATFLATPSSANLASAVSDETGTGALVFANSPTLVTPTLGAASATSLQTTGNVTVGGDLIVNGSTTQVNTTSLTVEDNLVELGLVNAAAPSSDLNIDLGLIFNYYTSSAKKAAVFWDDSASRIVFADDVSESGGVLTVAASAYASIEVESIYVNDCAGQSQLITCTGTTRKLENITIDGGAF